MDHRRDGIVTWPGVLGWVSLLGGTVLTSAWAGPGTASLVALVGAPAAVWLTWRLGRGGDGRGLTFVRQAVPELTSTAHSLSELAEQITVSAHRQASRVGAVAAATEEIAASAEETARHAERAAGSANETYASAETGWSQAREAIATIRRTAEAVEKSTLTVEKLEEAQQQVRAVVGLIREVTFQTNLLALNAAIEAARAGPAGAGFAVVAGEVRSLAHRTERATAEIATMVGGIEAQIAAAVTTMRAVAHEVEGGARLVAGAEDNFAQIRAHVAEVRAMIAEIAQAAAQQSSGTTNVARTMDAIAGSTTQTAADAQRVAQASQGLWVLSDEMRDSLGAREGGARRAGRVWVLPMCTILDPQSPPGQALSRMADRIEAASGGRLRVQRQLGARDLGERDVVTRLRRGELAFSAVTTGVASNYLPELQVLDLPYAFDERAQAYRVLDGPLGRRLLDGFGRLHLVGLGYLEHGNRHFTNARHPIRQPEDLRGLVVRVMESSLFKALCHALGATPKVVAVTGLREAIRTGAVDAQENPLVNIYQKEIHRLHRHLTLDAHTHGAMVLLGSQVVFDALPADLRAVVEAAARETVPWNRELCERTDAGMVETFVREGVQVVRLSAAEREAFRRVTRPVWEQFRSVIGDATLRELERELARWAAPGRRATAPEAVTATR
jgi:tripartite ATP-independent transporter DctP family solute receptor